MPALQTLCHALNQLTARDAINTLDATNFGPDCPLSDRIRIGLPQRDLVGLVPGDQLLEEMAAILDTLPVSIHDSIREIIRGAIGRNQCITFAWRPGYDFKLEVSESIDSKTTHGGITVVLESRYPSDPHPLYGQTAE